MIDDIWSGMWDEENFLDPKYDHCDHCLPLFSECVTDHNRPCAVKECWDGQKVIG